MFKYIYLHILQESTLTPSKQIKFNNWIIIKKENQINKFENLIFFLKKETLNFKGVEKKINVSYLMILEILIFFISLIFFIYIIKNNYLI